jgi:hypothetical protein
MKTWRFICLLAFVFGCLGFAWAQPIAFMVLQSKGLTEVNTGEAWASLKVGTKLKTTDEIKVPVSGSVVLYHVSGKPLEVKEAGQYKVVELAAKVGKGSTALSKYTDFILSSNEEKKTKLAATGAVHRGEIKPVEIYLPDPSKADLLGDSFSLNWKSDGSEKFTVILMDLAEEELAKFEVSGTSLDINFSKENIKEPQVLIKVVSASGNSSAKAVVRRMAGNQLKKTKESINALNLSSTTDNAMDSYILANVYEERLLLIDALTAYKAAHDLEHEVEFYRNAYNEFLQRLGFTQ